MDAANQYAHFRQICHCQRNRPANKLSRIQTTKKTQHLICMRYVNLLKMANECFEDCWWKMKTMNLTFVIYTNSAKHAVRYTLRASLSGTLLQTLPDLVTPLKGRHSLSSGSCPATRSPPSKRFGSLISQIRFLWTLSPFLTGRMFVRRTYFGQFDEL